MKDQFFHNIDIILKHIYSCIMWIVYKYKTMVACKQVENISEDYKKEIRNYWKKYYRRMDLSSFKWYKTKNGSKNVRFIPDIVFHSKIEPYYNDIKTMDAFSNKCYFNLLFQGFKVPYTIVKNINGAYMDDDFNVISYDAVIELCRKEDNIIIKPAIDSGGGRNITFLKMQQRNSVMKLENILKRYGKDFLVQRVIVQHEELNNMNPTSLNTVKVLSFFYKGKVHILYSGLRIGLPGSKVDNLCAGGISIAIKSNGEFHSMAFDGEGNGFKQHARGYIFEGNRMPEYDKIIASVKKLHPRFVNFGLIGWDIALDKEGEPVFIEFNLMDTCIQAAQLSFGPLFQDLTDEVLDEVFHKKKKTGKKLC